MPKLSRAQWLKTPYAKSQAKDPDGAIRILLGKYEIHDLQWTEGNAPSERPFVLLRFIHKNHSYRIMLEGLDAQQVERAELVKQVKRAIFYYLKSTLELTGVFFAAEQALFAFLEMPQGGTLYEAAAPHLDRMVLPDFGRLLGLPQPKE